MNTSFESTIKSVTTENVIPVRKEVVQICAGGAKEALLLTQLIYWTDRAAPKNCGWVFESLPELSSQLGLSIQSIRSAAKNLLALDYIETKTYIAKGHNTTWYRVKQANILEAIKQLEQPVTTGIHLLESTDEIIENSEHLLESTDAPVRTNMSTCWNQQTLNIAFTEPTHSFNNKDYENSKNEFSPSGGLATAQPPVISQPDIIEIEEEQPVDFTSMFVNSNEGDNPFLDDAPTEQTYQDLTSLAERLLKQREQLSV
jgi:hypothetical protein